MKPHIQRPFTATPGRQRGAVMVLIVIALASMLLMGALALDGGHMLLNKTRLQNAVDAAALSGAKTLQQVAGSGNAYSLTRDAALNTLWLNAKAAGNAELITAIDKVGGVGNFAVVELAARVYGSFSAAPTDDARFVRVRVRNYGLTGFFWGAAQSLPGWLGGNSELPDKAVAAIATAGPSPTKPCKIEPLLICGNPAESAYNPDEGLFWGFEFGVVTVLKSSSNNESDLGPGNFQLLDFGSGGNTVEDGLANGIENCDEVGETVTTEPGNKVGPVVHGLNTRFEGDTADYVPDVTERNKWISLDGEVVEYNDSPVEASAVGELVTEAGTPLFDYVDWLDAYASANCPGDSCILSGAPYRRMMNIVIGDCTGQSNGKSEIPVLGFACYFTLQPVRQGQGGGGGGAGQESQIFGQFIDECNGDNVPTSTPWNDSGPQIIQLYKTYIDDNRTPSSDS